MANSIALFWEDICLLVCEGRSVTWRLLVEEKHVSMWSTKLLSHTIAVNHNCSQNG